MTFYDDNDQTKETVVEVEEETVEVEKSQNDEIIVEESTGSDEKVIKANGKKSAKKGAGKVKATVSELKKVTWPSFGKVVKSTVVVLSVTAAFLLVVLGIDQLLYLLYNLLTKNM